MLRIGLTGGIGAGKSTVAARLRELGALVIDADQLAREIVEPGTPGLAAIVEAFGSGVLLPGGSLDRPALGRIVFGDEDKRRTLNSITHPLIGQRTAELLAGLPSGAVWVHDVPLLVEGHLAAAYHLVIVVWAPEEERVRRLVADRGMTEEDAWARVRAQATDEQRRAVADVWIDNSGSRQNATAQVDRAWQDRVEPLRADPPD
jgi:dephospho-CoA kinase